MRIDHIIADARRIDRQIEWAEQEADRLRVALRRQRIRRARRGDASYTQNPARFPTYR
jgi:hypothetical protein